MAQSISGYTKRYSLTSYKKFSFKDNNATWKARRQAANERYFSAQSVATNAFDTGIVQSAGQVQLTIRLMNTRFQKELAAKADERSKRLDELYSRLDKLA